MINPNLDFQKINEEFQANKIVEVPDFLQPESAENLHKFFNETMPQSWWAVTIRPGNNEGGVQNYRDTPENQQAIQERSEIAMKAFRQGFFAYIFRRSLGDHYDNCNCAECEFRGFLSKPETMDIFGRMSGNTLTRCGEQFASCYTTGCFLSPHHDKDKGKIGFIMNLSKYWLPQFGGSLHFMTDDWKGIKRVIVPKFNNLVMFDIPTYNGVPHFVSHVAPEVPWKRLAIGGWYF